MSDLVTKLRGAYSTVFERSLAKEAADRIEKYEAFVGKVRDAQMTLPYGNEYSPSRIDKALAELDK